MMAITALIRSACWRRVVFYAHDIVEARDPAGKAQDFAEALTTATGGTIHVRHAVVDFASELMQETFGNALGELASGLEPMSGTTSGRGRAFSDRETVARVAQKAQRQLDQAFSRVKLKWERSLGRSATDPELADAVAVGFDHLGFAIARKGEAAPNRRPNPALEKLKTLLSEVDIWHDSISSDLDAPGMLVRQLASGCSEMVIGPTRQSGRLDSGALELLLARNHLQ